MESSFLSSEGRIGRMAFSVRIIALIILTAGVSYVSYYYFDKQFHGGGFGPIGVFCSIVMGLICSFAGLMQLLKRLRDMGKEAYLSLLMLLPGANFLFLVYACTAASLTDQKA